MVVSSRSPWRFWFLRNSFIIVLAANSTIRSDCFLNFFCYFRIICIAFDLNYIDIFILLFIVNIRYWFGANQYCWLFLSLGLIFIAWCHWEFRGFCLWRYLWFFLREEPTIWRWRLLCISLGIIYVIFTLPDGTASRRIILFSITFSVCWCYLFQMEFDSFFILIFTFNSIDSTPSLGFIYLYIGSLLINIVESLLLMVSISYNLRGRPSIDVWIKRCQRICGSGCWRAFIWILVFDRRRSDERLISKRNAC